MRFKIVWILVLVISLAGCKSKKMTAVENLDNERPAIEKETDIVLDVESPSGIMTMEERFSFANEDDKTKHDERSYFVIIGSFRERSNADRFSESLVAKGFDPVILLSETGLNRISVDSYADENDARARIMQIRNQFSEHEDTWLLIKK
jgi:cell division protein FtsN